MGSSSSRTQQQVSECLEQQYRIETQPYLVHRVTNELFTLHKITCHTSDEVTQVNLYLEEYERSRCNSISKLKQYYQLSNTGYCSVDQHYFAIFYGHLYLSLKDEYKARRFHEIPFQEQEIIAIMETYLTGIREYRFRFQRKYDSVNLESIGIDAGSRKIYLKDPWFAPPISQNRAQQNVINTLLSYPSPQKLRFSQDLKLQVIDDMEANLFSIGALAFEIKSMNFADNIYSKRSEVNYAEIERRILEFKSEKLRKGLTLLMKKQPKERMQIYQIWGIDNHDEHYLNKLDCLQNEPNEKKNDPKQGTFIDSLGEQFQFPASKFAIIKPLQVAPPESKTFLSIQQSTRKNAANPTKPPINDSNFEERKTLVKSLVSPMKKSVNFAGNKMQPRQQFLARPNGPSNSIPPYTGPTNLRPFVAPDKTSNQIIKQQENPIAIEQKSRHLGQQQMPHVQNQPPRQHQIHFVGHLPSRHSVNHNQAIRMNAVSVQKSSTQQPLRVNFGAAPKKSFSLAHANQANFMPRENPNLFSIYKNIEQPNVQYTQIQRISNPRPQSNKPVEVNESKLAFNNTLDSSFRYAPLPRKKENISQLIAGNLEKQARIRENHHEKMQQNQVRPQPPHYSQLSEMNETMAQIAIFQEKEKQIRLPNKPQVRPIFTDFTDTIIESRQVISPVKEANPCRGEDFLKGHKKEVAESTPSRPTTKHKHNSTIVEAPDEDTPENSDPEPMEVGELVNETYDSGSRYQGYKSKGMRNGRGKFFYQNGGYYDGYWRNNKMDGWGKLFYESGLIAYEGNWREDEFNGFGKVYNDNPTRFTTPFDYTNFSDIDNFWEYYQGLLLNDTKEGRGKIKLSNGEVFEGDFHNDRVHGFGRFKGLNDKTVEGIWREERLVKIINS